MKIIFAILVSLLLYSCSPIVKKIAGLKNPKVETKETINEFLSEANWSISNNYILEGKQDSALIMDNILKCLKSEVLLFDSLGLKYCYKMDEKCEGIKLKSVFQDLEQNFVPCENDTVNIFTYFSNLEPINSDIEDAFLEKSEYYLIIYWSKFYGGKKRLKEKLEWISSLNDTSKYNISIILINTDLQADWGLKEGKRLKLKFRFLGKKSASLEFGQIPYNNIKAHNSQYK